MSFIVQAVPTIPSGTKIVDRMGEITTFFRLLWQTLINSSSTSAAQAIIATRGLTATIPTTNAFVAKTSGWYRVSYYLHKTVADGVSSSLTMTIGWTDHGVALSQTFAALTTDTTQAQQNNDVFVYCDANAALTYGVVYASNTPAKMTFDVGVVTE